MTRRNALRALLGFGSAWLLTGHSPYGQWDVFRKSRLIVFSSADDAASQAAAQALAARILKALPTSNATWARAANAVALVNLLASHQADVALLRVGDAVAAREGTAAFAGLGPTALSAIAQVDGYLLVATEDVPARHGWQLARALGSGSEVTGLPLHVGAREFLDGKPEPALAHDHH